MLSVLVLGTAALIGVWRLWFDPHRETISTFEQSEKLDTVLTGMQAAQDLKFIVSRLKERHPACISSLPVVVQEAYEREYIELAEKEEASVLSLWQSASRVLACLGDAHTTVGPYHEDTRFLPLMFSWEGQSLLCSGGQYSGYTVRKIGGVSVEQLYEQFQEQFSYELDAWALHAFASRINRNDYLAFLGINAKQEVEILLEEANEESPIIEVFELQESATAIPVGTEPFYNYSIDVASGVGIFTLRQCIYDKNYKDALKDFFKLVQNEEVHSVIVDLRGNPGGNSLVANEFIRYLPVERYQVGGSQVRFGPILWNYKPRQRKNKQADDVFSGDVYVLTGTDSFSAAMDFATLLSDNGLCKVVGESPGNMPSSYGDILYFQTPNAGLVLTVSYKYFIRPNESKSNIPLVPDVQVPAYDAMEETLRLIHKN